MRLRAACDGCMLDLSATQSQLKSWSRKAVYLQLTKWNWKPFWPPIIVSGLSTQSAPCTPAPSPASAPGLVVRLGNGMRKLRLGCTYVFVHQMITGSQNRRNHAMTLQKYPQTLQTPGHAHKTHSGWKGTEVGESWLKMKVNVVDRWKG